MTRGSARLYTAVYMTNINPLEPSSGKWERKEQGRFVFWSRGSDMVRISLDQEDEEVVVHLAIKGRDPERLLADFGAAGATCDRDFPESISGVTHWFLPATQKKAGPSAVSALSLFEGSTIPKDKE